MKDKFWGVWLCYLEDKSLVGTGRENQEENHLIATFDEQAKAERFALLANRHPNPNNDFDWVKVRYEARQYLYPPPHNPKTLPWMKSVAIE